MLTAPRDLWMQNSNYICVNNMLLFADSSLCRMWRLFPFTVVRIWSTALCGPSRSTAKMGAGRVSMAALKCAATTLSWEDHFLGHHILPCTWRGILSTMSPRDLHRVNELRQPSSSENGLPPVWHRSPQIMMRLISVTRMIRHQHLIPGMNITTVAHVKRCVTSVLL